MLGPSGNIYKFQVQLMIDFFDPVLVVGVTYIYTTNGTRDPHGLRDISLYLYVKHCL